MELANWCHLYHHPINSYNNSTSLDKELIKLGIKLYLFKYRKKSEACLPSNEFIKQNNIHVLLVNITGESDFIDDRLIQFKKDNPNVILINFLGDEPQTRHVNFVRAITSDVALSPDAISTEYWKGIGVNCKWWNHWADLDVFQNLHLKRSIFLGTTMGKRKYSKFLKCLLGNFFINKRVEGTENSQFYSSVKVAFQYARFNEITRRIFEASACGCCVLTNKLPEETRINEIFRHNETILFFQNHIHLIYLLLKLSLNKTKAKRISRNAEYLVKSRHSAANRASEIYAHALECKKFNKMNI
tara:strand:- start:40 stop:942 length:903 start_codon:yes stop_codon:yes gene_type:complete